jgi:hypothetical protein
VQASLEKALLVTNDQRRGKQRARQRRGLRCG